MTFSANASRFGNFVKYGSWWSGKHSAWVSPSVSATKASMPLLRPDEMTTCETAHLLQPYLAAKLFCETAASASMYWRAHPKTLGFFMPPPARLACELQQSRAPLEIPWLSDSVYGASAFFRIRRNDQEKPRGFPCPIVSKFQTQSLKSVMPSGSSARRPFVCSQSVLQLRPGFRPSSPIST